jgi:hypothetical protein
MEPSAPPPATPFNPAPAQRPAGGGCPKPLILGCLGLLVLAGLGLVGFFFYAGTHVGQLLQLSLRQSEAAVFSSMPKDVPAEEQQRLRQAFEAARQRAGHPTNPQEIAEASQQLQLKTLGIIRKGQAATRKDIQDLTAALEEFAKTGQGPDGR